MARPYCLDVSGVGYGLEANVTSCGLVRADRTTATQLTNAFWAYYDEEKGNGWGQVQHETLFADAPVDIADMTHITFWAKADKPDRFLQMQFLGAEGLYLLRAPLETEWRYYEAPMKELRGSPYNNAGALGDWSAIHGFQIQAIGTGQFRIFLDDIGAVRKTAAQVE